MESFVIDVGGVGGVEKVMVSVKVIMRKQGQRYGIGRAPGLERRGRRYDGGAVVRPRVTMYGLGL
jgi:hypothetical protein